MAQTVSARWFDAEKDQVHVILTGVFRCVRDESQWKREADEYHATMYAGATGASGIKQSSRKNYSYGPATLPYNIARGATDTLVSKVAKHRPQPQVLSNEGDWKAKKKSKKMTQYCEGAFYRHKIFEKWAPLIVRDAGIFRSGGWLKIIKQGKRPLVERLHPWEVYYDDWDARYDDPRNIYICRPMDRGVALAAWGKGAGSEKRKRAIMDGGLFDNTNTRYDQFGRSDTVDRLDVLESFHLCDNIDAHEAEEEHECTGRHVGITTQGTLFDVPWKHQFFPIARLRYNPPLTGSDGGSLVEQLEGFQYEINLSAERISEGGRLMGLNLLLVPDGAGIYDQEIRNGVGAIVNHKAGGTIQVVQPAPFHPAAYQRLRDLPHDALGDVGISAQSAMSQKTPGVEAGIAIQTIDDIETERFIVFGRAYEAWCLDCARLLIAVIKEIAEEYGDYEVQVPMDKGLVKISWKDVEIDGYELRVFPTSLLPQQLGARLEKLKMLFESDLVDRATFLRELKAPDLDAELDIETADKMLVDEQIEYMLDADEEEGQAAFKTPSPYVDLKWAARRAQQKHNKGELQGCPEFNLNLLTQYIAACEFWIKKGGGTPSPGAAVDAPPPLPPPPEAGGMPPGPPGLGLPGILPPEAMMPGPAGPMPPPPMGLPPS